ncbi:MAG TPA: hypothetical protein VGG75_10355 [Trebonia sp.]|jgi:hypothetical protein
MTVLTALARALAAERGRAVSVRTVRHAHISDRPLVFIPLRLAGEANAPLAALVGDDPDAPRLLVVHEPRDRDQRFGWAADLADVVLTYIEGYAGPEPPEGEPLPGAPQILVPNPGGIRFCGLLGRSTRFRRTEGDNAVAAPVPVLGRWLTFYAERSMAPASSLLLSVTDVLADHWATGQSAAEDGNLAALLAWIDPPPPMTGAQAALLAEDPVRYPPAGPMTDPGFDNIVLRDRIAAVREARVGEDAPALDRARLAIEQALETQLAPTWALMWRAIGRLRELPEAAHVASRWERDRWSFTAYVQWLREDGAPQPRRDGPVSAARRLARLEARSAQLAAQRAYDDPLVMAEYRLTGEAFAGTVVDAQSDRVDGTGKRKVLRPRITVATGDEVLVPEGTDLTSPARPRQTGKVVSVCPGGTMPISPGGTIPPGEGQAPSATLVTLELKGGMGRGLVAPPGSIPEIGDAVTYTTLKDDFRRPPVFPEEERTPWTHGGPPAPQQPAPQPPSAAAAGPEPDIAWEDWS